MSVTASDRKKKNRGREQAPETISGSLPGDTYLLAFWHRRLALMSLTLEFLAFLPEPAKSRSNAGGRGLRLRTREGIPERSPEND